MSSFSFHSNETLLVYRRRVLLRIRVSVSEFTWPIFSRFDNSCAGPDVLLDAAPRAAGEV